MMRSTPMLLALLMFGFALAGCLGGDDEAPNGDGEETLAEEAVATEETGSISGQVVTNDLEVIEGASVGLSAGGELIESTTTDAQGKFTFNGVDPGNYRVQVSSVCCKVGVKEVAVNAGQVTDAAFQLSRLTQADLQVPFEDEREWSGFISCGVSTPAVSAALCAFTEDTPVEDPNEDFLLEFNVSAGIRDFVVVMDWDPVGGVSGGEFNLLVENDDCGFSACSYEYADLNGPPPLRADIDDTMITDGAWKWAAIEADAPREMQFRVFASGQATLIYQQPFTVYYTAFYFQDAPDNYDPVPDQ